MKLSHLALLFRDRATWPHSGRANGALERSSRPWPRVRAQRRSRRRGTASIELVICLLPVLLTFLAIVQYSLLFIGRLVVQHSATRALRSAIVVLDDDPEKYSGAPRGDLTAGRPESHNLSSDLMKTPEEEESKATTTSDARAADTHTDEAPAGSDAPAGEAPPASPPPLSQAQTEFLSAQDSSTNDDDGSGARLVTIRRAAYAPLAILAPPLAALRHSNVRQAVSLSKVEQLASGLLVYGPAAAAVTLHREPDSLEPTTVFGPHDPVTVRVAFLMPCRVPLVSRMMCKSGLDLQLAGDLDRFEHVANKGLQKLILFSNLRFMIVEGVASGVSHGATYHPVEEES